MPTRNAKFTYTDKDYNLTFAWGGGAYIDIFPEGAEYPTGTINVWDYEKNAPAIECTQEAFEAECREWIKDQDQ